MSDIVEKVARELSLWKFGFPYHQITGPQRQECANVAKAAIEAIKAEDMAIVPRDPSNEKLQDGVAAFDLRKHPMEAMCLAYKAIITEQGKE